jgi:hypothetical protein
MLLLAILALTAATRVQLVDEVYPIPADDWRYVPLELKQQSAMVVAHYRVETGPHEVRVALMRRDDVEHLREGLPQGVMALTDTSAAGTLRCEARAPGEYALVVDNRSSTRPASVHLRVWLDFGFHAAPEPTSLSPERRRNVILLSFAVFLGIVSWSAHKLLRGVRR